MKQSGFTLLEIMVAMLVLSIGLLGLAGLMTSSMRNNLSASHRTQATWMASDIIDRGMVMCGGGSLLRGMDKLLTKDTGVPAYVAENPLACVALGTHKAFRHLEILKRVLART